MTPDRDLLVHDIKSAVGLLTRLPMHVGTDRTTQRGAKAVWAFPLAGLAVALIASACAVLGAFLGLPAAGIAGLILTVQAIVTGAMHEDGLADCADGFWGGWDRARRLEIMKDSQIGTYGVLALGLSLLLRWSALVVLIETGGVVPALIASAMLSRAAMTGPMIALPFARRNGLSRSVGKPPLQAVWIALAIAVGTTLVLTGMDVILLCLLAAMVTMACTALARVKIGGQTGDVLGATQQTVEITLLLALAAVAV